MAKDMQYAKFWRAVRSVPAYKEWCYEVKDVRRFLKRITSLQSLVRRYPILAQRTWEAGDGRGGGAKAVTSLDKVMICCDCSNRQKTNILWVLAKYIDSRVNYTQVGRTDHGWSMCAIYMDLVRYGLGKEHADALKQAFAANKVRWKKPFQRTSEPTEAQLRARAIFAMKRKLYAKPNPELLQQ